MFIPAKLAGTAATVSASVATDTIEPKVSVGRDVLSKQPE
jgi:hypothetical protein